jgi:hypothetical protein
LKKPRLGELDFVCRERAELTHEVGLLQGGDDTRLGGGRDNRHGVALSLDPLELLGHAWALGALLGELLGDLAKLTGNEVLLLLVRHGEVVLLLQADEHVAEVVADEVFEEGVGVVGGIDVVLLHHLVGEISTGLERQTLGLAEGVVAVEEDVFDLPLVLAMLL